MIGATTQDVICTKRGACGHILLNRPQALNALTLDMVRAIAAALDLFEQDAGVQYVVVQGAGGKAFCAGADIRRLADQGRAGEFDRQIAFWREEYVLNQRIKTYPKPYISLIDGIVMGGGAGLSILGSHRLAGESFSFAMPEVAIGFFPDVGATYFLPRLAGRSGTYFALTGLRCGAGDAVALGLADAYVPSASFEALAAELANGAPLVSTIEFFARDSTPGPVVANLEANLGAIDQCFGGDDLAAILAALRANGSRFAQAAADAIALKSPTSLAIALRQMRIGGALSLEQALRVEFRIVSRLRFGSDFYEGVRATLVDKDKRPVWRPAQIGDVAPDTLEALFAPLGADDLSFGDAATAVSP